MRFAALLILAVAACSPTPMVTRSQLVLFLKGSAELTAGAKDEIAKAQKIAASCDAVSIAIRGDTDATEPDTGALAAARAESVRKQMAADGVTAPITLEKSHARKAGPPLDAEDVWIALTCRHDPA